MTVYIKPSKAQGSISAPPSKSLSHRAIICAALSRGANISNITLSQDINATIGALKALGANAVISDSSVSIGGLSADSVKPANIDVNESGSTLRFLIPIALIGGNKTVFTGSNRLFSRDLSVYEEIAKEQGIKFVKQENSLLVCGKLKSGEFSIRGDISSQFVSGLMFALPLLEGDSFIKFITPIESKPYIDMTVEVLSRFGIIVEYKNGGYFIKGNQKYKACDYKVEGDFSNAVFLDAFNLLGGNVIVDGLNGDTSQGDSIYREFFKTIKSGGVYDLSDCPDLAPVLFALSAHFSGAHFKGTKRLKIKESDRAVAMSEELLKFGAEMIVGVNAVTVKKSELHIPDLPLNSHNDHRIVMALSILASAYGGQIDGAEAVNKSYPDFFSDIKKLGIEVEIK